MKDFNLEEFSREEEENRQKKEFKDFLTVREISGTLTGIPQSSRIPAEVLIDKGGLVELAAEGHFHAEEREAEQPMVLIHRDENDEIESIEIMCTCGKRTHVRFKFNG